MHSYTVAIYMYQALLEHLGTILSVCLSVHFVCLSVCLLLNSMSSLPYPLLW